MLAVVLAQFSLFLPSHPSGERTGGGLSIAAYLSWLGSPARVGKPTS